MEIFGLCIEVSRGSQVYSVADLGRVLWSLESYPLPENICKGSHNFDCSSRGSSFQYFNVNINHFLGFKS